MRAERPNACSMNSVEAKLPEVGARQVVMRRRSQYPYEARCTAVRSRSTHWTELACKQSELCVAFIQGLLSMYMLLCFMVLVST